MVRPGVYGNLMASHVLGDEDVGVRDHTRTDDEERRTEVMVVQVPQELPVITTC